MKYRCNICGYLYDDSRQEVPFNELPDSWTCPLCMASKSQFTLVEEKKEEKPVEPVSIDKDAFELSAGQLSALFSNLARGAEKQYIPEAQEEFTVLSDWFLKAAKDNASASIEDIAEQLSNDINKGYRDIDSIATADSDRGALRVNVWGEKVTRMLSNLLERYQSEGEDFLLNTEVWVCTACGFIYVGDKPPQICPVCKVQDWKFEKQERRKA